MGDAVSTHSYTPQQRTQYRHHLAQDLELFDKYLQRAEFIDEGSIGLELELNLVDADMQPAFVALDVLKHLEDEYQTEIGAYNLELNHPPLSIAEDGLRQLHDGLDARLATAQDAAKKAGATVAMIGSLPTLSVDTLRDPEWMVPENRYRALSNAVLDARGELVHIDIARREHFNEVFKDIAPESACTSIQLHLQVAPHRFADAWNASQAIAGVQIALSANSPLFAGHQLWHESRIPLFTQAIDTRTPELVHQGVRPRVWFGERWITSVFDLFEENVRYFSPLLPEGRLEAEAPIMTGKNPGLHYLNLHNGTVWRWNRPIYDPNTSAAHIRVENRILGAGPSSSDIVADAAFYYGLVQYLSNQNRPVWSRMPFSDAEENFNAGARDGMHATMSWPTLGHIQVRELVSEYLLDYARAGLEALRVDTALIEQYLGIIEQRVQRGQNGATWQLDAFAQAGGLRTAPNSPERKAVLQRVLAAYVRQQASGAPVHTWPVEAV